MAIDLFAEVAGETVTVIIDGRGPTPVIVAGTGVRNVVRESQGTYLMDMDAAPELSYTGNNPMVIEGCRLRTAGSGGVWTSEIVSASQLRIRTYDNNNLVDALFTIRIRRY